MDTTAADDRVRRAIAGELAWAELNPAEQAAANAYLDAAIRDAASSASFGQDLLDAGRDAIVLNDAGLLVCLHPDGTATAL